MFFNHFKNAFLKLLFISAAGLGVVACGINFGDIPDKKGKARFGDAKFWCLSDMGERVNNYFSGKLSSAQVGLFMNCMENALVAFEFHAEGETKEGYFPSEIQGFLNKNIMSENQIGDELIRQAMEVKVVMAGGRSDFITKDEYQRLVDLVKVIGEEAVNLQPHIKSLRFFNREDSGSLNHGDLQKAKLQFVSSVNRFSKILSESKISYRFDSFEELFRQVRLFLNWEKYYENSYSPEYLVRLLKLYKQVMVNPNDELIEPSDWEPLLTSLAGWYGIYIDYSYLVKGQSLFWNPGLEGISRIFDEGASLFQRALRSQPKSVIEFETLYRAVDLMSENEWIPFGLRTETFKKSIEYFLTQVFRNLENSGRDVPIHGLTSENLTEIRNEYNLWYDYQKALAEMARGEFELPSENLFASIRLSGFNMKPRFEGVWAQGGRRYQELKFVAENIRPMFRAGEDKITIVPKDKLKDYGLTHNFQNLTYLNIARVASRFLIRGFAERDRAVRMLGLTREEMSKFYETAHVLGADLKIMDPRSTNSGERSFMEANLFTFSGDGINPDRGGVSHLVTQIEAIEYITLLYSSGRLRTELYNFMSEKCHASGDSRSKDAPDDIFGVLTIDRHCYIEHLGEIDSYINNLPYMVNYLDTLSDLGYYQFFNLLENLSYDKCYDKNWVTFGEIATTSTLMHYIEVLFATYDLDKNGFVDSQEAFRLYPRLEGYIKEQAKLAQGKDLGPGLTKSVYSFLLREKRLPETTKDSAKIIGLWFKYFYPETGRAIWDSVKRFYSSVWSLLPFMKGDQKELEEMTLAEIKKLEAESARSTRFTHLPEIRVTRTDVLKILNALSEATRENSPPSYNCN